MYMFMMLEAPHSVYFYNQIMFTNYERVWGMFLIVAFYHVYSYVGLH